MFDLLGDAFDFNETEAGVEQGQTDINTLIDDLIGPIVDNTPLNQLVSTGNEEQPPFTDDPDNVGVFAPGAFVFDLLG